MKKDIVDLPEYEMIIIDTLNLAYRYHYGMKNLEWKGKPTGMLYGIAKFIFKMEKLHPTARIIFLWEGINSKRQILYSGYKASRRKRETIFDQCLKELPQFLENVGVDQMYHLGLEADDMAAYLVSNLEEHQRALLISTDTDWFQFLKPGQVDIQQRDMVESYEDIHKCLGFPPERVGLWKVLKGDATDDIPGVKGLPIKIAQFLVNHCADYKEFREFPLHKKEHKLLFGEHWGKEIKRQWKNVIERNAELILFHEDWVEGSQIVWKWGDRDVRALRKTLEEKGMKSLLKGLK